MVFVCSSGFLLGQWRKRHQIVAFIGNFYCDNCIGGCLFSKGFNRLIKLHKCFSSSSRDIARNSHTERVFWRYFNSYCQRSLYNICLFSINLGEENESPIMHIYAFGSICRGDISIDSDIDLLALTEGIDPRFDSNKFSIYSYERICNLWAEGNAFAWHLALESKLIYAEDEQDFFGQLGIPHRYTKGVQDCQRFRQIFLSALTAIHEGTPSLIFELSTIFLAIRNIATCYSLATLPSPTFGRNSARQLGLKSVPISNEYYAILERARLLSTRGVGDDIAILDVSALATELEKCRQWINELCAEAAENG